MRRFYVYMRLSWMKTSKRPCQGKPMRTSEWVWMRDYSHDPISYITLSLWMHLTSYLFFTSLSFLQSHRRSPHGSYIDTLRARSGKEMVMDAKKACLSFLGRNRCSSSHSMANEGHRIRMMSCVFSLPRFSSHYTITHKLVMWPEEQTHFPRFDEAYMGASTWLIQKYGFLLIQNQRTLKPGFLGRIRDRHQHLLHPGRLTKMEPLVAIGRTVGWTYS